MGWLRPISATAMPTKPASATKSSTSRYCTPTTWLTATMPASAPESVMTIMMMRELEMPA